MGVSVKGGGGQEVQHCFVTTATHRLISHGLPFSPSRRPEIKMPLKMHTAGNLAAGAEGSIFFLTYFCFDYLALMPCSTFVQ